MEANKPLKPKNERFIKSVDTLVESKKVKSVRQFLISIGAHEAVYNRLKVGRQSVTDEMIEKSVELYPEYFNQMYILTGETPYLVTARILGTLKEQEIIELPLLDARAIASFKENIHGSMYKLETGKTHKVIRIPNLNYDKAMVMEIVGDSMLPNFRNGMKVIVREIPKGKWDSVTGIHAISVKGGMFTLKRILKNNGNVLTLKADNPAYQEEAKIQLADILIMFRVGEIVYAPPVQDL